MLKTLKDFNEYRNSKDDYIEYKKNQLEFFEFQEYEKEFKEFLKLKNEISLMKSDFEEFKSVKDLFVENKHNIELFSTYKDSFEKYAEAIQGGQSPYFVMYSSEIDNEGNIQFTYDYNEDFIMLLRKQGIQGIEDTEVIEEYMHIIYSQNYFHQMLKNQIEQDKENDE